MVRLRDVRRAQGDGELDKLLQLEQWLRICDEKDLVGIWECYARVRRHRRPRVQDRVQVAPLDAAGQDGLHGLAAEPTQLGAAQCERGNGRTMAVLDFEEFLETCARLGVDKYRAVKEVSPARAVEGFIQNLLGENGP